ncbi:hypothetical protein RO3G_17135 [Rhizopus delemar RA 99-880]|uniref:Uncharacterized protein n=1 Tax=Rhizopus delemar (strain RA 99-880 / ATCC MYA-4621 / FGSC 9543 / NRRL 43880) TaxID=246409 RepID=I1CVQ7_RHIO9|nr:hypothetical protein RO3G_17135 [Rhizopus delemar RA 99-880]|eukprot:EIE92537.1 hypothetical protein RO3G_17135 [Rhizopus delemar RA 99-880]
MDYIVDQNEFIVETIATHTEYLKDATSGEYSLTYPMSVEKSKDEDIRMKETKPKRDYVCYTVQDKSRFFDLKIEKFGRKCILSEEHKTTVIGLIDANPSVTVIEVISCSQSVTQYCL